MTIEEEGYNDDRVMRLTGEDAQAFNEYDSRPLTAEEVKELDEAVAFYKKHEHDGETNNNIVEISQHDKRLLIDLGDNTYLDVQTQLSDPDWKIRFNTKYKVFSMTSGTWCATIKPNGVESEWMRDKDIDRQ